MRAGFARVDITPPLGCEVAGQLHRRVAEVVLDPLSITAMVLDDGNMQVAIASADVILFEPADVAEMRALIHEATGIPDTHAMIHTTHTHTGPMTFTAFWTHPDEAVVEIIKRRMAEAVLLAQRDLKPAEVCFARAPLPGVAFNRRWELKDGTQAMHPAKDDPNLVREAGMVDETLCVMGAWRGKSDLAGAVVNFGSHPICVGSENALSADYCGHARRAVEAVYPGSLALYANGPCGDTCQVNVRNRDVTEYGLYWARRNGSIIGTACCRLLEEAPRLADAKLAIDSRILRIPIRTATPEKIAEAQHIVDHHEQYPRLEKLYANELLELTDQTNAKPDADVEIQVIWVGDAAFVGLPGEPFSEFGHQIRLQSGAACTFVVELANGWHGYVPTKRAFEGGGYETWLARTSKLVPEAGDMMVECAVRLLGQRG